MSFKDIMQQDLNIIFNTEEFASIHTIDGRQLKIIVDDDELKERSKKEYDGISVGEILYYVNASDYGKIPEEDTPQVFDGRMMYVFNAREVDEVYEIILYQNRGH